MIRRFLLILLLALVIAPLTASAQQPAPITITVQAGIDGEGAFRAGYWFPVRVTLTNDGADRNVTLEWHDLNSSNFTQRYLIDLPGGARKQIVFPVVQTGRAALLTASTADGTEILRQRVNLNQLGDDLLVIGLLSSDPAVLSSLTTANFVDGRRAMMLPLNPALLADNPLLLRTFDAIVVHELTAELQPSQREALLAWVQQDGVLLIGGGAVGDLAIRTFADVMPVLVGPLSRDTPVAELERLTGLKGIANFVPSLTAHTVTLRPNAQLVTNDGLISQTTFGKGRIIFAAFDLAALRAWPGESALWANVLNLRARLDIGAVFRFGFNDPLQGNLNRSLFSLPSTMTLLALIGTYIIIIGPLNFLVLRRLRRLEWAWLSTPLLVAIFLAGAYAMSFAIRGSQVQIIQLAIVESTAEGGEALSTTFTGIFAPQRRNYNLTLAEAALVSPTRNNERLITERNDISLTIPNFLLDASAFRTLIVEQRAVSPVQIKHQIELNGGRWRGTLTNTSPILLRDAMIVQQNDMQWIGSLVSGADITIDLPTGQGNFLREAVFSESESWFHHISVLENLFWFAPSRLNFFHNLPTLPDDGLYLIGWSDQVTPIVQIDGMSVNAQGETLYIIALQ